MNIQAIFSVKKYLINHIKSWLIFISIFSVYISSAQNIIKADFANDYIQKVTFYADDGGLLEMYAAYGITEDAAFFNRTFEDYDALQKYKTRLRSYRRALRQLVFQKEFDVGPYLDVFNACTSGNSTKEIIGITQDLLTTSDLGIALSKALAQYSNLKYIKNIDDYHRALNKMKLVGRNVQHGSLNNFGNAITGISAALNMVTIVDNSLVIYNGALLVKSLKFDYGLMQLEELRSLSLIDDPAYQNALNEVIQELKQISPDFWSGLAESIAVNHKSLKEGSISLAELATNVSSLITNSPISAWVGAGVFTFKTWYMVQDWQDMIRTSACYATIYGNLRDQNFLPQNNNQLDLYEFSQFFYFQLMTEVLSNGYLKKWELIRPGQKDVRLLYAKKRNDFKSYIISRKIDGFTACLPPLNTPNSSGDVFFGFILDSSGSMKDSDPKQIRKSAVKQIIDLLDGNEKIFLVDFDNSARWINKSNWNNCNANALKQSINRVDADGGTNIGAGLNEMKKALLNSINSNLNGGVLLFTDGKGDYKNEAEWFQQNNIPVYTISYKSMADANTMNKIASATGGVYLQANTEYDVITAFSEFFNSIIDYNKICSHTASILQGQSMEYSFYVDYNTSELISNLNWNGSNIGLELYAPDGKRYTNHYGGKWVSGSNYKSVKIDKPKGGLWKAVFSGLQIPSGGEPFRFEVSGDTPSKFLLENNKLVNGMLQFKIVEKNNKAYIANIQPDIIVQTPRKRSVNVSSNYHNGSFSFSPIDGQGNYNINVSFKTKDKQGNHIQREFTRSILIGDDGPSFIAKIDNLMGDVITTELGKWTGNQEGISCYIYAPNSNKMQAKAKGVVTFVQDKVCQISITEYLGGASQINLGDIVELDVVEWQNDH